MKSRDRLSTEKERKKTQQSETGICGILYKLFAHHSAGYYWVGAGFGIIFKLIKNKENTGKNNYAALFRYFCFGYMEIY